MAEQQTQQNQQTFEQAIDELEGIVGRMESGEMTLEESVEAYTRGKQLAAVCRKKLNDAAAKIKEIDAAEAAESARAAGPSAAGGDVEWNM